MAVELQTDTIKTPTHQASQSSLSGEHYNCNDILIYCNTDSVGFVMWLDNAWLYSYVYSQAKGEGEIMVHNGS